jgi:hypothetical protein
MANLTKSTAPPPSLATLTPPPGCQLTKNAFTDLVVGDMVYIKSDDTFALANGTANDALAQWWGMVKRSAKAGSPVTAFHSVEFEYAASGLTPGARYYVSGTAGALSDVATVGGDVPCAFATSATNVYVMAPRK